MVKYLSNGAFSDVRGNYVNSDTTWTRNTPAVHLQTAPNLYAWYSRHIVRNLQIVHGHYPVLHQNDEFNFFLYLKEIIYLFITVTREKVPFVARDSFFRYPHNKRSAY